MTIPRRTVTTYDANGRSTGTIQPDGTRLTTLSYDPGGRLRLEQRHLSSTNTADTVYEYDPDGRRTKRIDPRNEGTGFGTVYGHDALGRQTSVTDPEIHATSAVYDERGNRTSSTDERGNETVFEYDPAGRLTYQRQVALKIATGLAYDKDGNLVTRTGPWLDVNVNGIVDAGTETAFVQGFTYDKAGRLENQKTGTRPGTTFEYDAAGNQTRVIDGNGHAVSFAYDRAGRLMLRTTAEGIRTRFVYDRAGRRTRVIENELGVPELSRFFDFNAAGELTRSFPRDATLATAYGYDANGRRRSVTDALGHTTLFEYDQGGRLIATVDPRGSRVETGYDDAGNRTVLRDPRGHETTWTYDRSSRMKTRTYPPGDTTGYTYDASGNLETLTPPGLGPIGFAYDAAGRLTRKTLPGGKVVTYAYDERGNRETIQDNLTPHETEYVYTHDDLDRVKTVTDATFSPPRTVGYDYDEVHLRTLTEPGGARVIAYTHDTDDRLTRVERGPAVGPLEVEGAYTYNGLGMRTSLTYGHLAGLRPASSYLYDTAGRLEAIEHRDATGPTFRRSR